MTENKLCLITNLFEEKEIRSIWNSEKEDYYFSVVDMIGALTDSNIPRNYWSDLKRKLKLEGSQLHENIVQLKMKVKKHIHLLLIEKMKKVISLMKNLIQALRLVTLLL